jgi:Predicted nucleotide-binding protein containing TIR-like domain/Histidine-specific methyltransferase, SAM-dependent
LETKQNSVFLVHGRHEGARDQLAILLSALHLHVTGWSEARAATGLATPTTLDVVRAGIQMSTCVVVLLTGDDLTKLKPHFGEETARSQPRPNVIFEAGWALATSGSDRTILVALDSVDLMSDIDGLNYIRLNNSAEARRDFARRLRSAGCEPDEAGDAWLDPNRGGDFLLPIVADVDSDAQLPQDQLGGLYTEYVVDSALTLELSHASLYQDMADAIRQERPLPLKYHYVGSEMAKYWTQVCADNDYGHDLLTVATVRAIEEIIKAAGIETQRFNFVSLGPGDGRADIALLDRLQEYLDIDFFYLVDISLDLLQQSVAAVISSSSVRTAERNFRMKAILADFEISLACVEPILNHDDTPAFYALTGYTLGNTKEDTVIEALHETMRDKDLLLVDARLHEAGTVTRDNDLSEVLKEELVQPYSSPAVRQFAFGPVQIASQFAINFQDVNFVYEVHVGRKTSVNAGINVSIKCAGLDKNKDFVSWLSARVGKPPRWRRPEQRPLELASVTYYDFETLQEWFVQRGFDVVWSQRLDAIGLFVLRPTVAG